MFSIFFFIVFTRNHLSEIYLYHEFLIFFVTIKKKCTSPGTHNENLSQIIFWQIIDYLCIKK